MASKRMFSFRIINSAKFLQMPIDAQNLYFHLGIRADDDGVVEAYPVMRLLGASEDNLKILIAKKFIRLLNDDLVVFIIDWLEHNRIRADRKTNSIYKHLLDKKNIETLKSKPRKDLKSGGNSEAGRTTDGQRTADGRHRLGKVRLGKVRLGTTLQSNDCEELQIIPNLLDDKNKHIKIIGLFARAKNVQFKDKQHQADFIKRNIKPASRLKNYDLERIVEVMKYLVDNADFKWTIETIEKYVDENLDNLTKSNKTLIA